jgi:hypothetical protein
VRVWKRVARRVPRSTRTLPVSYIGLEEDYLHQVIDHAEKYVDGQAHTRAFRTSGALLKRGLNGTYVPVEPLHLFRYLAEQVFRINERKDNDQGGFLKVEGRRLTYAEITGKTAEGALRPKGAGP